MPDDAQPAPSAVPNLTRAGVTGKVPAIFKRGARRKAGKGVKLSADSKRHARSLQKQGVISPRAAMANGIK